MSGIIISLKYIEYKVYGHLMIIYPKHFKGTIGTITSSIWLFANPSNLGRHNFFQLRVR